MKFYRERADNDISQLAEGAGFEPAIPFGIRAFQARALGRYATPPKYKIQSTKHEIPNKFKNQNPKPKQNKN